MLLHFRRINAIEFQFELPQFQIRTGKSLQPPKWLRWRHKRGTGCAIEIKNKKILRQTGVKRNFWLAKFLTSRNVHMHRVIL